MPVERSCINIIIKLLDPREGGQMKCYVDALEGKDKEAVAICIVCGMGVCLDHAIREDVTLWEGGYPFPSRKGQKIHAQNSVPGLLRSTEGR